MMRQAACPRRIDLVGTRAVAMHHHRKRRCAQANARAGQEGSATGVDWVEHD